MMSNRISHFFNLQGPSLTVDTGCSASLVCFHLACQSLISGESDMAIVAGAGMILTANTMMPMMGLNFLSPDGKCYTFDSRANGYGRGEGVGVLVLKRLPEAIKAHNPIRCVVRGTSVNQDGNTPAGITVPSMEAQAANIRQTYRRAGLSFDETGFVECHGTGTQAGDSRELQAIGETIGQAHSKPGEPVIVGSIKTNIGHLEGAAGVAGIIKTILCIENGRIPPHLNFTFETRRREIDFVGWNVTVPTEVTTWPSNYSVRRGSVNCFGFGGTNAHAILDDARSYLSHNFCEYQIHKTVSNQNSSIEEGLQEGESASTALLFVYSAHEKEVLERMLAAHTRFLKSQNSPKTFRTLLEDYSCTLLSKRSLLSWKKFFTARSPDELREKIECFLTEKNSSVSRSRATAEGVKVAFVFCGQGAQYFNMGRKLMSEYTKFRSCVKVLSEFLVQKLGAAFDIFHEISEKSEDNSRINEPAIAQPATTIIQIALVDFLESFGVTPSWVIGHSSGEIAAAYAKKAISRDDALRISYLRGQAASSLDSQEINGTMCAIWLGEKDALELLEEFGIQERIQVACINSPSHVTLSGDSDAIEKLENILSCKKPNVKFRRIPVSVAYHSHHMTKAGELYLKEMKRLGCQPLGTNLPIKMISTLQQREVTSYELEPDYWAKNLISPVRFSTAMEQLLHETGLDVIIELGPSGTLRTHIEEIISNCAKSLVNRPLYVSALGRRANDAESFLDMFGLIFQKRGAFPLGFRAQDFANVLSPNAQPSLCADLPAYPFNHQTQYKWESQSRMQLQDTRRDLIGRPVLTGAEPEAFRFRAMFRIDETPYLEHHRVQGAVVYPAAGMVIMAVEAGRLISQHPVASRDLFHGVASARIAGFKVTAMEFRKPMVLPNSERGLEVNLVALRDKDDPASFDIVISSSAAQIVNSRANLKIIVVDKDEEKLLQHMYSARETEHTNIVAQCQESILISNLYQKLDDIGLQYGPIFRNLVSAHRNRDKSTSTFEVQIPDTRKSMPQEFEFPHIIHPATLDSIFHAITCLQDQPRPMVPTKVDAIFVPTDFVTGENQIIAGHCSATNVSSRIALTDIVASSHDWKSPALVIKGLQTTDIAPKALPENKNLCSTIHWDEDVNHLTEAHEMDLARFVQLLAHKKPGLYILMVQVPKTMLENILERILQSSFIAGVQKIVLLSGDMDNYVSMQKNGCLVEMHTLPSSLDVAESLNRISSLEHFDLIVTGQATPVSGQVLGKHLKDGGILLDCISKDMSPTVIDSVSYECMAPKITWSSDKNGNSTMCFSAKIQTAGEANKIASNREQMVTILVPGLDKDLCMPLANKIHTKLLGRGFFSNIQILPDGPRDINFSKLGEYCISLLEVIQPNILNWAQDDFLAFKQTINKVPNMVWATRAGAPEAGIFQGLARTLVSEKYANPVMIDMDVWCQVGPQFQVKGELVAQAIFDIFTRTFESTGSCFPTVKDREYMVRFEPKENAKLERTARLLRTIKVPRLVPLSELNKIICPEDDEAKNIKLDNRHKTRLVETLKSLGDSNIPAPPQPPRLFHDRWKERISRNRMTRPITNGKPSPNSSLTRQSVNGLVRRQSLDSAGIYILAGGLGGLGRIIAEQMVEMGARVLSFITRGDPSKPLPKDKQDFIETLRQRRGVRCDVRFADIASQEDVRRALAQTTVVLGGRRRRYPIKGVVMAAAVLDDSSFENMSFLQWEKVLRAKAQGSMSLYDEVVSSASRYGNCDFFIMLSSAAGIIGNYGQANYNAANAVQDAIAREAAISTKAAATSAISLRPGIQKQLGRLVVSPPRVVSLALGPVLGAGMLGRDDTLVERLRKTGFIYIERDDFRTILRAAMVGTTAPGNGSITWNLPSNTVIGASTGGLVLQNKPRDPFWTRTALWSYLGRVDCPDTQGDAATAITGQGNGGKKHDTDESKAKLLAALSGDEACSTRSEKVDLIAKALVAVVTEAVGNRAAKDVDPATEAPAMMGIDSISGIEVRDWVGQVLEVSVSIMEITGGMSFCSLAEAVVDRLEEAGSKPVVVNDVAA